MKIKRSGMFCLSAAVLMGISLLGTATYAAYGTDTVTLGKVPVEVTVNVDENNYFVKGLLEDAKISIDRADTTREEVEELLINSDSEILMFPAEYTVDNTPLYMYTFITDGYTNQDSTLIRILNVDSWLYLQRILDGYYSEEEEPDWQDYHVTETAVFTVVDRVYLDADGEASGRMARDYYTIWNGDLVQVMVVYNPIDKEFAVKWTEDYLATWKDVE